ncbi:helix-turn-helix domain-containing protein [Steroidobacter cummioxidans]|uniref:helix-turn-helix domain-containing protein n=1 Tax=Steroidobacter cummioxidans TaxID=1803913 RepID=UPI000E31C9F5
MSKWDIRRQDRRPMKLLPTTPHRQLIHMLTGARQRASLSQSQLAEKVSVQPAFVTKYESGGGKEPSRRR